MEIYIIKGEFMEKGIILVFDWFQEFGDDNDYAVVTVKDNQEFVWQIDKTSDLCVLDDLLYAIICTDDVKFHSITDVNNNNEKFFPISEKFFRLYEKRCVQRGEE